MRLERWLACCCAALLGGLLPLSLAPLGYWPLGLVACAGLFYLWERYPARLLSLGWWFGVGKYGIGMSWIYVSIHTYGNAGLTLSFALVALFVAGVALFALAQGWLYGRFRQHENLVSNGVWYVLVWVLWEWLLTWLLSGLPWLYLGYAHLDTPLGALAPVGGVLLVSLAVAISSVALCCFILRYRNSATIDRQLVVIGLIGLLPWLVGQTLAGASWTTLGDTRTVALVQNNTDQKRKWLPGQREPIVQHHMQLTEPHWGKDLILWPEAAVTYFEHQIGHELAAWQDRGQTQQSALVMGIPNIEVAPNDEVTFFNTAIALGDGQGRYVKQQLVPFGEYVPLQGLLRGLIDFFDLPMSRSAAGPSDQDLMMVGTDTAAMAICYEIAYPALVARQIRGKSVNGTHRSVDKSLSNSLSGTHRSADVLLTISNDAWFGTSLGPDQHLQIAQMRAKENARYVLRATQSGWTAIIEPTGQLQARLPRFQPGVLTGTYQPAQGLTPYTRWGNGLVLGLILSLALVMLSLRAFRWRQQPADSTFD